MWEPTHASTVHFRRTSILCWTELGTTVTESPRPCHPKVYDFVGNKDRFPDGHVLMWLGWMGIDHLSQDTGEGKCSATDKVEKSVSEGATACAVWREHALSRNSSCSVTRL